MILRLVCTFGPIPTQNVNLEIDTKFKFFHFQSSKLSRIHILYSLYVFQLFNYFSSNLWQTCRILWHTFSAELQQSSYTTKQPSYPETQNKRQATKHDSLHRLLGDGDKRIEIMYSGDIYFYWADKSSQGRTKISCTGTTSPSNHPRKDPFHWYFLSPHSPQFQQSAGSTPL